MFQTKNGVGMVGEESMQDMKNITGVTSPIKPIIDGVITPFCPCNYRLSYVPFFVLTAFFCIGSMGGLYIYLHLTYPKPNFLTFGQYIKWFPKKV